MRLWSLHPRLLDRAGLIAVWREGLLARAVLLGKTKGYRHHPQLERFRRAAAPSAAMNSYLLEIAAEGDRRGYSFDRRKLRGARGKSRSIPVAEGQIDFERRHLLGKLKRRDPVRAGSLSLLPKIPVHPLFRRVRGGIEEWERL